MFLFVHPDTTPLTLTYDPCTPGQPASSSKEIKYLVLVLKLEDIQEGDEEDTGDKHLQFFLQQPKPTLDQKTNNVCVGVFLGFLIESLVFLNLFHSPNTL